MHIQKTLSMVIILSAILASASAYAIISCEKADRCFYCEQTTTAYDGVYTWSIVTGNGTLTPNPGSPDLAHYLCANNPSNVNKIKVVFKVNSVTTVTDIKTLNCDNAVA